MSRAALGIVYFGSGEFGLPTLRALAERHHVQAIITQPDRPAGRARKHTPTPVGAWAAEHAPNIPLLKPENVNAPEVMERTRGFAAEVFVVIAFGQKLGRELLGDRFAINLHASLLPRWRGAAPINHAILAGDRETGNSVITLADRMDAGEILGQTRCLIAPTLTAGELHDRLSLDGPDLLLRVLDEYRDAVLHPVAQDGARVTLAGKLGRQDAVIDWNGTADTCRRRINGLSPWPGVSVRLGGSALKLLRAETDAPGPGTSQGHVAPTAVAGELVDPSAGLVRCGGGTQVRLLEVQPAGGTVMSWTAFAHGRRPSPGERLLGVSDSC